MKFLERLEHLQKMVHMIQTFTLTWLGFGTTLGANHIETLYHPLTAIMSSSKSKNLKKCYYISMRYITTNNISLIDLFCHTFGWERLGTYKCNVCEGRSISDQNKTLERPPKVLMMVPTQACRRKRPQNQFKSQLSFDWFHAKWQTGYTLRPLCCNKSSSVIKKRT